MADVKFTLTAAEVSRAQAAIGVEDLAQWCKDQVARVVLDGERRKAQSEVPQGSFGGAA